MNIPEISEVIKRLAPPGARLGDVVAWEMAKYMQQYGHLDGITSIEDVRRQVTQMQDLLGVTTDGYIGDETYLAASQAKRCGLRTVARLGGQRNRFRPGLVVNLYFAGYIDGGFTREVQEAETLNAAGSWEVVSGIRFNLTRDANRAHLIIDASNDPREEFGTIGQVLAWCEMPYNTDFTGRLRMKFDRAERWTPSFYRGTFAHEVGHGMGLDHTTTKMQLLFAYFQDIITTPQTIYDIPESRARYPGSGTGGGTVPVPPGPQPPVTPSPLLVTIQCTRPVTVNGKLV